VERDDGVVYHLDGFTPAGPRLPHDIRHLVVERELGITDGRWAGIAAGAVRDFQEPGLRAEMIAVLVEEVAALDDPSPKRIRRLARARLAVLPDTDVNPAAIAAAARALQVEAARWARLRVGESLSYEWPRADRAQAPRLVRAEEGGMRRRPARWSLRPAR
jgi:hypothetical protein